MAKQIAKQKKRKSEANDPLYTTLPGSIICSVGIANKKSHRAMMTAFNKLKNSFNSAEVPFDLSVDNILKWICDQWDLDMKKEEAHLVLVYDDRGLRSPLVTNWMIVDEITIPLPLAPSGTQYGILAVADTEFAEHIVWEFLDEEATE